MEAATTPAATVAEHHNPFEVLELGATATARDVTRQKDKLLGMLELGLERAKKYTSSFGDKERTADLVRSAAQELERPRSRLTWELWLKPSDEEVEADPEAALLRRALILHHQLLKETATGIAFGVDELDELGIAWDEALASDWLYNRILDRASELELDIDEGDVFDELRDEIREQMRTMFDHGPAVDLDALSSELASEVAHELADRKVELLELACSQIARKRGQQTQREQQWHGLVREYANAVVGRGDYFRRTAFESVSATLSEIAVELFNNDIDHQTALSMFRWLSDEARNLDDDDKHATHAKNVTIVADRIARDAAALTAAYYDANSDTSSSSGWDGLRIIGIICVGIVLAMIRTGDGCKKSEPTFEPPAYQYRPDPEVQRLIDDMKSRQEEAQRLRQETSNSEDESP